MRQLPPGPRSLTPFGCRSQLTSDPLLFLQRLRDDYGDVCSFRVGTRRIVQLNHPDYVREFFVMQHDKLRKTGLMKQAEPVLGQGLFLSEGDLHRKQRKLIQPVFGRQQIGSYAPIVVDTISDTCQKWKEESCIDLFAEMLELTLKVTTRTLFGIELSHQAQFQEAVKTVIGRFSKFLRPSLGFTSRLPTRRNRSFRLALNVLNDTVLSIVRDHVDDPLGHESRSIVSTLLNQNGRADCQKDEGSKLIRDEIMTLLVAGHETVATAITWTSYLIAQYPRVEAKLLNEWHDVLGGRSPCVDDVESLVYTRMVLTESMRLYPPVWGISRMVVEDFNIGEYVIPRGYIVGVSPFVSHRDDRFFPEPCRFDPERWATDQVERRPRFSYFPFGGGPRLCIGEPLAWLELTLLLATIGQNWKLQLNSAATIRMQPLVTLRPLDPIPVILKRRKAIDRDRLTDSLTASSMTNDRGQESIEWSPSVTVPWR